MKYYQHADKLIEAYQEAGAAISASMDALARLREIDVSEDGPLQPAKMYLRTIAESAHHTRTELRPLIPVQIMQELEGVQCVGCGE